MKGADMYDVALLIERQLTDLDADQVVSLHEGLDESVTYHLLLPVDTSASMLASSMSALGAGQIMTISDADVIAEVQDELSSAGRAELEASAALLTQRGQAVTATLTEDDPIDALGELVSETKAAEAIILTDPHVVREFLHLDWTSRAKRRLDVPLSTSSSTCRSPARPHSWCASVALRHGLPGGEDRRRVALRAERC